MLSKYGARKAYLDGIMFDSIKEAQRYKELRLLELAGDIKELQCQVKYVLIPAQRIGGKVAERECAYIADFVYYETDREGGWVKVVEDVKGYHTKEYIIKRKLMLERYGIRIKEV